MALAMLRNVLQLVGVFATLYAAIKLAPTKSKKDKADKDYTKMTSIASTLKAVLDATNELILEQEGAQDRDNYDALPVKSLIQSGLA